AGTDDAGRRRPAPSRGHVPEDAGRRQRDDPAQELRGQRPRRHRHHRRLVISSAFTVSRFRNIARMIARPTAASAAATVITKNTITCPSVEARLRANATKVRFTAFSMSSIAMKMTMMFRRTSTPSAPITNSTAERTRYQESGVGPTSALLLRERHRAHDRHEKEDRRELEGQEVVREELVREGDGRAEARGQRTARSGTGAAHGSDEQRGQREPAGEGRRHERAAAEHANVRLEVQQHDDEEEEDDDRARVDDDLEHGDELRVEADEEHREKEERRDERERAVHGVRPEHDAERAEDRQRREHEEEELVHAAGLWRKTITNADATTFASERGRRPCQPRRMSWS